MSVMRIAGFVSGSQKRSRRPREWRSSGGRSEEAVGDQTVQTSSPSMAPRASAVVQLNPTVSASASSHVMFRVAVDRSRFARRTSSVALTSRRATGMSWLWRQCCVSTSACERRTGEWRRAVRAAGGLRDHGRVSKPCQP